MHLQTEKMLITFNEKLSAISKGLLIIKTHIMKRVLLSLFIILSSGLFAQEINKVITDKESNSALLIGTCNREGLSAAPFGEFFTAGYADYAPDEAIVKKLSKQKKGVSVAIVMGSWCSDSKEQVPRFIKILDDMKFKDANLSIISVDSDKQGGDVDVSSLDIQRVPTFILYKNDREIGRIVETPNSTLEKDLLLILSMGS